MQHNINAKLLGALANGMNILYIILILSNTHFLSLSFLSDFSSPPLVNFFIIKLNNSKNVFKDNILLKYYDLPDSYMLYEKYKKITITFRQ